MVWLRASRSTSRQDGVPPTGKCAVRLGATATDAVSIYPSRLGLLAIFQRKLRVASAENSPPMPPSCRRVVNPKAYRNQLVAARLSPASRQATQNCACKGPRTTELTRRDLTGRAPHHARLHHRLAADEPRELTQPHEYALSRECLKAVIEAQQQSAAVDHHRRLRQQAGSGGGDEIGDAQRRAEHAGAVEHAGRDEFAQPGRELLVDEADMAEEDSERNEGAAGVIDGNEGGISDDVERLLAAIVGVCPPADVGEKARHMAQPALFSGLVEPGGRHEAVGPGDQLLAVGG